MKTLNVKSVMMMGLILPSLSMALNDATKAQLDSKLAAQKNQARGVSVNPVKREYIERAIEKVGGKGTVEFGKSGGVVVGSGADGLVATSNMNEGGPIVITPPLLPQTSITVVGRSGAGQQVAACAFLLTTDAQGNVLRSRLQFSRFQNNPCALLGKPIRLTPGKYFVSFSSTYLIVDLKSGENKIIPLREISIPKYQGEIIFRAYRETCSLTEITKTATSTFAFDDMYNSNSIKDVIEMMLKFHQQYPQNACGPSIAVDRNNASQGSIAYGRDGSFFSVLPGVYSIVWTINDQVDTTGNITVE
jgi:hypothetical protein